ncbi:hypothetical protein Hanom_Chr09g00834521 [Helianthus anomalus]
MSSSPTTHQQQFFSHLPPWNAQGLRRSWSIFGFCRPVLESFRPSDNWLIVDFHIRWFCSDNQFWFILTINSISSTRL